MANITVPPLTSFKDNNNHEWSLGAVEAVGRQILRDNVQFASGQGVLLLLFDQRVYAQNNRGEWWFATEDTWQRAPGDPRLPESPRPTIMSRMSDFLGGLIGGSSPLKHPFAFGLGMSREVVTAQQVGVLKLGFATDDAPAFKFLTMDRAEMIETFERVRQALPQGLFMARLFCPFNVGDPVSPERFVREVTNGLEVLYDNGVRLFEVHNEPNLPWEGLGDSWHSATEFAGWLRNVIGLLRSQQRFPEAKWLAPGLSPKREPVEWNTELWLRDWKAFGVQRFVDGFCAHAYWQEATGRPEEVHFDMFGDVENEGGLAWRAVKRAFPDKPVYITEFSNNRKGVPFSEKGQQYRTYRQLVKQNGAAAAFGFVLHWDPKPEEDHDENWAHDNGGSLGVAEGFRGATHV